MCLETEIKNLTAVVGQLTHVMEKYGDAFSDTAHALENSASNIDVKAATQATLLPEPTEAPAKKPTIAPEPKQETQEEDALLGEIPEALQPEPTPDISLDEVREMMTRLASTRGQAAARGILADIGYKKMTDVPAEKFPEIKQRVADYAKTA